MNIFADISDLAHVLSDAGALTGGEPVTVQIRGQLSLKLTVTLLADGKPVGNPIPITITEGVDAQE